MASVWASGAELDLAIRIAVWSSQAAIAMSIVLMSWIIILRARLNARTQREDRLKSTWREILADAVLTEQAPQPLPALDARDLEAFLHEWNALQDSLALGSRRGLNALIERLGLVERVRALLREKRAAAKAVATATLGHLQDGVSWENLLGQLDSDNHVLSLLAARSLMQIDSERALPAILVRMTERQDWSPGRLAALLHQAGPDVVSGPLCEEIVRGPAQRTAQLLPFITAVHDVAARDTLAKLLETSSDEQVICECLRVTNDPSLLPWLRRHLEHPQWYVRLLAVEALGRVCGPDDVGAIVELLSDSQWWVRYRAAQALVRLPWMKAPELERIYARQPDAYARQILEHTTAELRYQ